MFTRSSYEVHWYYVGGFQIGANIVIPPGNVSTAFDPSTTEPAAQETMPTLCLPYFSIDVVTDNAILVDIEQGPDVTVLTPLVTLTCGVGLGHNTVYDLPPPHNKDGFLILTSPWTRLRVRNTTGEVVASSTIFARAWR